MINRRMDSKTVERTILFTLILSFIFFSCSGHEPAAEFTADIEISSSDTSLQGKIYVDGYLYRIDIDDSLETISIIVNQKKNVTWILLQTEKVCSYMNSDSPASIKSDPFQAVKYHTKSGDKIFLSDEFIDSFTCIKSEIKDTNSVLITWESNELGFPLKIIENNETVTILSNITQKEIPESLFTIPEDYIIMLDRWRNK